MGPRGCEWKWRRLQSEEIHSLYRLPNKVKVIKSRRLRWAGHVARMEEDRDAFKMITGKPTGKRPLGRPRRRWEDDIRMDLKEIGVNTRNWIYLVQERNYLSHCGCRAEPLGFISYGYSFSFVSVVYLLKRQT